MAKLVRLTNSITEIPTEHKQTFYDEFGTVIKQLLVIKDINIFYTVLAAFIEWAKDTELGDLNFCVP